MLHPVSPVNFHHSYLSAILLDRKRGQTLLQKVVMNGLGKCPAVRTLAAVAEVQTAVPSSTGWVTTTCDSRPRSVNTVFWPSQTPTQICACMCTHKHK